MWFSIPDDWVEIDDAALQAALDTLDWRKDCFGFFYERHNGKRFATYDQTPAGTYRGSPEYFSSLLNGHRR